MEDGDVEMEKRENEENYKCDSCASVLKTMKGLENHKINAHVQKKQRIIIEHENTTLEGGCSELEKERKSHRATKLTLAALENEYKACREELKIVQEEKERYKIKSDDLESIKKLTVETEHKKEKYDNSNTTFICAKCEYPFKTEEEMTVHYKKHQLSKTIQQSNHICSLCEIQCTSSNDLFKHITSKHISEFNCQECDFQASSQIILSKHMNLRHREMPEQTDDTHKCTECGEQFSALWNHNNHVRDIHGVKEDCAYFKRGKCKYPDRVCWKKHTQNVHINSSTHAVVTERNTPPPDVECYICKNKFKTKRERMLHRLDMHLEKVMPCRNSENCQFTNCWYRHQNKGIGKDRQTEDEPETIVVKENVTNNENFQKAPVEQKPPESQNV